MARPRKQPEQKSVRQNISIPPELLAQVVAYCQENDRPVSWVFQQVYQCITIHNKTDILRRKDGKCFVRDCTLYAHTYITCWECTTPGDIIGTTESFVTGIRNLGDKENDKNRR